ncbi:hypothetical protein RIVM261_062680 [Rivularia sp. IAM M-261]|nr:hypothetical protein CAL7716_048860 [Calothrix sp. PCC 7716]GJD21312.1 hypothetical protein RIVM261_062680 [Rivularia sp. IAM M-261]
MSENKKEFNLLPKQPAPVQRQTPGFNQDLSEELSEEVLTGAGQGVVPSFICIDTGLPCGIPFAGSDAE